MKLKCMTILNLLQLIAVQWKRVALMIKLYLCLLKDMMMVFLHLISFLKNSKEMLE